MGRIGGVGGGGSAVVVAVLAAVYVVAVDFDFIVKTGEGDWIGLTVLGCWK